MFGLRWDWLAKLPLAAVVVGLVLAIVPSGRPSATTCTPSWHVITSPRLGRVHPQLGALNAELLGVEPVSRDDVWAVGKRDAVTREGYIGSDELIEHWDGAQWGVVSTAGPGATPGGGGALKDVSAASARAVWAVGGGVIEHWDGRTWRTTIVRGPADRAGLSHTALNAVSARSRNDVWVAGSVGQVPPNPFLVHWDGRRWTKMFPNGRIPGQLWGIEARSRNDAWAVGNTLSTVLINHWNGRRWTRTSVRKQGVLEDVAVAGASVWAVGADTVLRWRNGRVHSFPMPRGADWLQGVAPVSERSAWAVAGYDGGPLRFNGARWNAASVPPRINHANLWGISARTPSDIWAVGAEYTRTQNPLVNSPLIARFACHSTR